MTILPPRSQRVLTVLVLLMLALLIAAKTKHEVMLAGNETSRLAVVEMLVEQGTFAIDNSDFKTVDRSRIGGHFYSDKPLLLTCWFAAIYWILHHVFSLDFEHAYGLTIYLITVFGVGSFSVLLPILYLQRLRSAGYPFGFVLLGVVSVVLTTWIFSYGTTINNHTPAAVVLFGLLYVVDLCFDAPKWRNGLLAGLLAGVLFNLELATGGIFFLGVACMLATGQASVRKLLPLYVGGFALLVLVMLALNYAAYGSVLPIYLMAEAKNFPGNIHNPAFGALPRSSSHVLVYLFHVTFGDRGLFSYMPCLLFAAPALWAYSKRERKRAFVLIGTILAVIFFYGTRTDDYGGWAYGFRYLIPLIPVLFWFSLLWLFRHYRSRLAALFYITLVAGAITAWVGAYNPWLACYEGDQTRRGAIEENVRNPFTANLLCMAFEQNPRSMLTHFLIQHLYGEQRSRAYLVLAYTNMKRPDLVQAVKDSFSP